MADVTTNAFKGLVKTLDDVVALAIPANDPLAFQELKLVVRYLNFARERVDHLHARARYELGFYAKLAEELAGHLRASEAAPARELADLRERAQELLAQPEAAITALRDLCQEIASRISTLLCETSDAEVLRRLERSVVLASEEIIAFDRSWYAPLKLERFPDQVRPLGSFIPL